MAEFLRRPIGTGPYIAKGIVEDHKQVSEGVPYATLLSNLDYWKKGYPKIRKITFVRYSPKNALRALSEGKVDLVRNHVF